MKKLFFWTVTLLSVIYSCTQKEIEIITPEEPGTELIQLTVRASIGETDGTKTAIQPNKTSIFWTPGDAINLFYGELSAGQFTTSITEPAQSADFNGTLSVATGTTEAGMSARHFWGVYPYNVANSCDGDGVILTIPSAQQGVPNTFADKLNPTVATSAGLDLGFYNVGSWFIFSVTQENVVSATLQGNTNEDIAGTIRVTMDGNSRPVASVQSGAKSITITPQTGDSFVVGEEYYMVLIPQTLSGGYTLTLTKADGSTAQCVKSNEAAFVRSQYRRKSNADDGLIYIKTGNIDFADAAVKTICVNNWDTNSDGELSYAEAAAVTSIPYSTFAENTTITSFDEFQYFTGLTSLNYTEERDEGEYDYFGTFYRCTNLASIILPPTLKTISAASFRECTSLSEITIPASVTNIQALAFLGCPQLDVIMESETPCALSLDSHGTYDHPYSFGFLTSMVQTIYVPTEECLDTYKNATWWTSYKWKMKWIGDAPVPHAPTDPIQFADDAVKAICVANWDTNSDGELSYEEAAAVTNLGQLFKNNTDITSFDELHYFSGLTSIGSEAFYGCSGLTSIILPEGITSISISVFKNCSSLSTITIPESITLIDYYAFSGCTGLTGVYISDLKKWCSICCYDNPLRYANHLYVNGVENTDIILPSGVYSINAGAFMGYANLTSIVFPEGFGGIGSKAFQDCTGLVSVTINGEVTNGNYTMIHDYAFSGCSSLAEISLPEGVRCIKDHAFSGCTNLSSITLKEGLVSIEYSAFSNCPSLTSITIPSTVTTLYTGGTGSGSSATGAFYQSSLETIEVYSNSSIIEYVRPEYFMQGSMLYLAFNQYSKGTKVSGTSQTVKTIIVHSTGGDSIIGDSAFSGFELETVSLPLGLTSIGNSSFKNCNKLTSIDIPDTVTSIGNSAFLGCTGLTSITIPGSVTSIGSDTFSGCTGLTSITIPGSITSIGNSAFSGCTGLTSITIPGSVTSIGYSAFSGCSGLTSITIPDTVTSIRSDTFSGCTGLTSITIPGSITSIGNSSFKNCNKLTSIDIPDTVTSIGNSAFLGCTGLTSITIPGSVTSIGSDTFSGCTGLTSITIPDSVTSIGSSAFYGCYGLQTIRVLPTTPPTGNSNMFYNTNNSPILVPSSSVDEYKSADIWSSYASRIQAIVP